jgi:hypothetical protein
MADEQTPLLSGSNYDSPSQPQPVYRDGNNENNLLKFRRAIGINIDSQDADLESARRGARGLYKAIIAQQRRRSRQYHCIEILFYLALGAQIMIGATLSALGPLAKLHPTSITILGIANTSIAGVLALLKGQGLPDRLRKDEFEMRKVQDFIEETEARMVLAGDTVTQEEVDNAVQKVFLKYNAARDTAEMNRPDSYGHQPEGDVQRRVTAPSSSGQAQVKAVGNGKAKD